MLEEGDRQPVDGEPDRHPGQPDHENAGPVHVRLGREEENQALDEARYDEEDRGQRAAEGSMKILVPGGSGR